MKREIAKRVAKGLLGMAIAVAGEILYSKVIKVEERIDEHYDSKEAVKK